MTAPDTASADRADRRRSIRAVLRIGVAVVAIVAVHVALILDHLAIGVGIILALSGYAAAASLLSAPPFLILMGLAVVFGRTLLPGQEAMINRFMRLELGEVPDRIAATGRRLTLIWACLFAAMAIESVALMALTDFSTWSWLVNVVNPAVMILFFVGQHLHSRTYLPDGRTASANATLRRMLKPEVWMG